MEAKNFVLKIVLMLFSFSKAPAAKRNDLVIAKARVKIFLPEKNFYFVHRNVSIALNQ